MLFYNQITELVFTQFLVLAVYEVLVLLASFFVLKKFSWKTALASTLIALALSLMSLVIAQGDYSGTRYREQFGWPFWYYTVTRHMELGTPVAVPYIFQFDFWRFIANTAVWGFTPLMILLALSNRRNKKFVIFAVSALGLLLLLTASLSYANFKREQDMRIDGVIPVTQLLNNPSSLAPSDTSEWQIYTNATYNFTVQLPEGYSIFYEKDDSQIDFDSEGCAGFRTMSGVWPENCQSYDLLIQKDPIEVDRDGVTKRMTTVAGFPAGQIETEGGMSENMAQTLVQFQKGDVWYIQTITYHVDQKEEAEATLNTIMESFEFTN